MIFCTGENLECESENVEEIIFGIRVMWDSGIWDKGM
jgi:hypothetical protein